MAEEVKRERLAYGPAGAEDEAEAQAKLLEQLESEQSGAPQQNSDPEVWSGRRKSTNSLSVARGLAKELPSSKKL